MAITVKHKFVSAIPDGTDDTIVRPSNWNDDHDLVGTVPVANGGTGASTLTGYVKGNGTSAMTAASTIPNTDVTGLGTASTKMQVRHWELQPLMLVEQYRFHKYLQVFKGGLAIKAHGTHLLTRLRYLMALVLRVITMLSAWLVTLILMVLLRGMWAIGLFLMAQFGKK
jgi:hypothetical protein